MKQPYSIRVLKWRCGNPRCPTAHKSEEMARKCPRAEQPKTMREVVLEREKNNSDRLNEIFLRLHEQGWTYEAIGKLAGVTGGRAGERIHKAARLRAMKERPENSPP